MKYKPEIYAKALIAVIEKVPENKRDKITKRFVELVIDSGDIGRGDKILEAIQKLWAKETGRNLIKLEFARPVEKEIINKLKKNLSEKDLIEITQNPDLIAGVRVTINDEKELDNTLRHKLNTILR